MINDLRLALRHLWTQPGFSLLAVLILALGIGPNTAVFSAFDQLILRLLPVDDPHSLVLLDIEGPPAPGMSSADNFSTVYSFPQYVDYRDRTEVFSGVAARAPMAVLFADGASGERVAGEIVSGNFFAVLGVRPAAGRLFTAEDDRTEGAHPVAVISHRFWTTRLGADPSAVGRSVRVNGRPVTIIGVVAPEFAGLVSASTPSLYMTMAMRKQMLPAFYGISDIPERMVRHLNLIARLAPGVSLQQAELQTQAVFKGILDDELEELGTFIGDPDEFTNRTLTLTPALQGIHTLRRQLEQPMLAMLALVGLVLLIACINLAGLMMARFVGRSREMALRTALGAKRAVVIRQVLLESAALSLAGGLGGLLVASATLGLLQSLMGSDNSSLVLNWRAVGVTFGLALLSCPLFGLLPALSSARVDVGPLLKEQTAGSGEGRQHTLFRKGAVVFQLALSLCLLVAAGLFARTLWNLGSVDTGFRTEQVLTFGLEPALNGYRAENGNAFYWNVLQRLEQVPGVRSVGAASLPLLGNSAMGSSLTVEGYQPAENEDVGTQRNLVSPGFFETLGVPVLLGREFEDGDTARKVAVVNEVFARKYFADRDPVGRHISFSETNSAERIDIEVVGVVRDLRSVSLRDEIRPFAFIPYWQEPNLVPLTFYLLAGPDPAALGPAVRAAVAEVDVSVPVLEMETLNAIRDRRVRLERNVATLAASLSALATVLSVLGLYGLVAYTVARRRLEIGVRVAFGASRGDVLGMVLKEALLYLAFGLLLGLPASIATGRLLESQLFGLGAADPVSLAAAVALLSLGVVLAALIPARRAAGLDPSQALRQ